MNLSLSKPIAGVVAVLLVAALALFLDGSYGQEQTRMTRVGGTMNQCTCTQRLDK